MNGWLAFKQSEKKLSLNKTLLFELIIHFSIFFFIFLWFIKHILFDGFYFILLIYFNVNWSLHTLNFVDQRQNYTLIQNIILNHISLRTFVRDWEILVWVLNEYWINTGDSNLFILLSSTMFYSGIDFTFWDEYSRKY